MENYGMSPADYAAVSGSNRDGVFGGDGAWWIIILFLFAMFGGWNNGWGNNGTNGAGFQGYATRADINEGFRVSLKALPEPAHTEPVFRDMPHAQTSTRALRSTGLKTA